MVHILSIAVFTKNGVYIYIQKQDLKNSKKKKNNNNNNFLLTQLLTKKQNFSFFFSSTGEEKGHKSFTFKVIPPVRMSLWILYQKPTGRNRVGKSLPIMFSIVRTAGASPAELTNGKSCLVLHKVYCIWRKSGCILPILASTDFSSWRKSWC